MANYSRKTKDGMVKVFTKAIEDMKNDTAPDWVFICCALTNVSKEFEPRLVYITKRYFKSQKPTKIKHKEFTTDFERYYSHNSAWWTASKKGCRTRIKFLEKLIKQLKKN